MKHCSKCNTDKPKSEFYVQKRRNKEPRLSGYCRECTRVNYLNPMKIAKYKETRLAKIANAAPIPDLPGEIWKAVVGYEDVYEVSNKGRVKSHSYGYPKLRKAPINKALGYRYLGLTEQGENKTVYVHRLVAEAFIPNPHNKNEVNHKDGDKANNDLSNLEWVTHQENIQHAIIVLKKHGSIKN